jgi:hypothetical protein
VVVSEAVLGFLLALLTAVATGLGALPLLFALIHPSVWKEHSRKFAPGFGGWHHAYDGKG